MTQYSAQECSAVSKISESLCSKQDATDGILHFVLEISEKILWDIMNLYECLCFNSEGHFIIVGGEVSTA